MQLRQIQLQHISVQGHGADKCRLVFDSEGFHLFLNDGVLFRCRLEAVINRAFFFSVTVLPLIFEIHLSCRLSAGIHFIAVGSGLFFTAASGKKPCLAHCRSFRRSLPKRKIFAVWTDLETWSWLSRCASLAMPANDEGKLIAYKWRKSAILETPEQIFLPGRNSRCTFSQTPLTPTWEKLGKLTPPPGNFFST